MIVYGNRVLHQAFSFRVGLRSQIWRSWPWGTARPTDVVYNPQNIDPCCNPDPPCMEYLPIFTIDLGQMSVNMCKMHMLVILIKVCRKTHNQLFGALLLDVEFPTFVCRCVLLFIAFALNLAAGKLVSPQNEPLDTKSHDFCWIQTFVSASAGVSHTVSCISLFSHLRISSLRFLFDVS